MPTKHTINVSASDTPTKDNRLQPDLLLRSYSKEIPAILMIGIEDFAMLIVMVESLVVATEVPKGMHVSLSHQVQQVEDTCEQMAVALVEAATTDLFRRSVFFVSIGSNDFIHYYLRNVSGVLIRYLPWEFNQILVNAMRQRIKLKLNGMK
ncbi:hypothetical protein GUJ93_ZPchr0011g28340 [Zizania palustris]|uniref:Uncharacterized protein n=1 Tax=Zizania palustris TaxID=103762 RepID=A0A8J5WM68_ZIZPA|nr:hypothetical protein GUJ93_ZPchr0011g28340 [Zizania palustris]